MHAHTWNALQTDSRLYYTATFIPSTVVVGPSKPDDRCYSSSPTRGAYIITCTSIHAYCTTLPSHGRKNPTSSCSTAPQGLVYILYMVVTIIRDPCKGRLSRFRRWRTKGEKSSGNRTTAHLYRINTHLSTFIYKHIFIYK